jgi:hypothetical protein
VRRLAEIARRWQDRERRRALRDPVHLAEVATLRAEGYLVIDAPGCLIAMRWQRGVGIQQLERPDE